MKQTWGAKQTNTTATKTVEPETRFDEAYYRNLFENNRTNSITHRCALVGHENTLKTGLALSFLDQCASTQPTTLCLQKQGMNLRDTFTVNGLLSLHQRQEPFKRVGFNQHVIIP